MILERSQSNCLSQHVTRQWSVEIAFIDILKHLFDNDDNVIVFDCDRLKRITKHFVRDWRKVILFSFVNLNIDWNFLLDLRLVLLLCVSEEIYSFFQQSLKQQMNFVRSLSSNKHIYWLHLVRRKKKLQRDFWNFSSMTRVSLFLSGTTRRQWPSLSLDKTWASCGKKKKEKSSSPRFSCVCVCFFSSLSSFPNCNVSILFFPTLSVLYLAWSTDTHSFFRMLSLLMVSVSHQAQFFLLPRLLAVFFSLLLLLFSNKPQNL